MMATTAISARARKTPPRMSAAEIGSRRCSSHMKRAAQKKPSATTAAAPATTPPMVDFSAMSILCLRLAIGPSNTGAPPASTAPCRAEQEAQADRESDDGERMLLDRLLQRLAEMVGHLTQGLATALADVGHSFIELVLHAARTLLQPGERLRAARAQQVRHLAGEPRQIVAQGLHVTLYVLDRCGRIFGGRHCKLRATRHRSTPGRFKSSVAGHSGNSPSSPPNRWRTITRPRMRNGTDRNAPTGPHSHVQNARLRNTPSGLRVSRRPTMFGVTT